MEKYYLWLIMALGEGEPEINRLLRQFGTPEAVYDAFSRNIALAGTELLEKAAKTKLKDAEKLLANITAQGYKLITAEHKDYPERLKKTANPPCVLFAMGNTSLLRKKLITMVGSRNITEYTEKAIPRIINCTAKKYTIVGTLSEGCDQTVFLSALRYGIPFIEILPCGLSQNYPAGSKTLRRALLANGGLLLTEYLPKEKAGQGNFLRRSRILGGISDVTLVLQARAGSGALATAEYSPAPIFLPPNNIFAPEYAGAVAAVRSGARLYMDNKDIELAFARAETAQPTGGRTGSFRHTEKHEKTKPDDSRKTVTEQPEGKNNAPGTAESPTESDFDNKEQYELYLLVKEAGAQISLEELIAKTGRNAADLSETLLDLEIAGRITSTGNRYSAAD